MKRLEVASPAQLAEAMNWKRGTERLVAKWLAGEARPGFLYMMDMLDATGWLEIEEARTTKRPLTEDEIARAQRAYAELGGLLQRFQEGAGE